MGSAQYRGSTSLLRVGLGGRSPAGARRRAKLAFERVMAGRGWAGPVRRTFERYLALPKGTTTDEAWQADVGDGWAGWHPW
jgi:hypothetical protein